MQTHEKECGDENNGRKCLAQAAQLLIPVPFRVQEAVTLYQVLEREFREQIRNLSRSARNSEDHNLF